ncbi:hypothetical protein ACO1BR_44120, partial [Streptomyces sp. YGL11-2]
MNPLDGPVEMLPEPWGAGAAGEEGAAVEEDDGAAPDAEGGALCDRVGEGDAGLVATVGGGAEADGGPPADDVLA